MNRRNKYTNVIVVVIVFILLPIAVAYIKAVRNNTDYEKMMGCRISNGIHSADLKYLNTETKEQKDYKFKVEVEDCVVISVYYEGNIDFVKSEIFGGTIDMNGNALISDKEGRIFSIYVEK